MASVLGRHFVEVYVKDSQLVKGLNAAAKRLKAFGDGVAAIGARVLAAGAALGAPLVGAVHHFAAVGDQLNKMSARTGVSTDALAELGFAAEQSGQGIEVVEQSLRRMQKAIGDAAKGSQTAQDALARVGVRLDEIQGLSPDQQLERIADGLAKIEDPTLRAAAAMEIFGRSGTALLPLFADGAKGIRALRQEARDLGLGVSPEEAQAAADFVDAWNRVKRAVKAAFFAIGSALAPAITALAETTKPYVVTIGRWVRENKTLIVTFAKLSLSVIAGGAALVVLGKSISLLGASLGAVATVVTGVGSAIGALGTLLAALLSPIGLVTAGVAALAVYLVKTTDIGGQAVRWLGDRFNDLKTTALAAWQGIGDALAAGDIGLAAKVLWLTLKLEWQKGINFLHARWLEFNGAVVSSWSDTVYQIARLATDGWAGLQVGWVETVDFLADVWSILITKLMRGWNRFSGFFRKVWARIKGLLGDDNAEVEVARINQEVAAEDQRLEQRRNEAILQRDEARQAERTRIERERAGSQAALDEMQAQDQAEREARHQAALAGAEAELAKAQREFDDARAEATRKRAQAELDAPDPARADRLPRPYELDNLLETTQRRIDAAGTFNPLAVRGLGSDSLPERTARAAEEIAANTKRLLQEAQHGGLVFA